jgi:hypothetical protein
MQVSRGNIGWKGLLVTGGVVALGVFGVPKIIDKVSDQFDARTYGDTIGDVKDKFGEDAKVVSIAVSSGRIGYEVIGSDGQVQVREYIRTSEDLSGGKTGYDNEVKDSTRALKPGEAEKAVHTLGEFDGDLVDQMWDDAGFGGSSGSGATFDGTYWYLLNGANPFDKFQAEFDGSNVRQTQTKEDVFGAPGKGPASGAPLPSASAPNKAQELSACVAKAAGNTNALQACISQ